MGAPVPPSWNVRQGDSVGGGRDGAPSTWRFGGPGARPCGKNHPSLNGYEGASLPSKGGGQGRHAERPLIRPPTEGCERNEILTPKLQDYQKLDAGVSLVYKETYQLFLNGYNLLGQDLENLDDALTVIDGEPVLRGGFRARW